MPPQPTRAIPGVSFFDFGKNETPGGHWLQVQVEGGTGVN